MTGTIRVAVDAAIATITIDRPEKHNAITPDMARELAEICRSVDADPAVRVVVIRGQGEKAFSAGSDLNALAGDRDVWEFRNRIEYAAVVRNVRKPVVAALQGWVLGGGLEIALSADVRIAGRSARFGAPEVKRGWLGGGGASQMLPRLIGAGAAMHILLSGDTLQADQAMRLGLIEELVEDAEVFERAHAYAALLATHSAVATQAVKAAVRAALDKPFTSGIQYENELHVICMQSHGRKEGIEAFQQKRDGRFGA